MKPTLFAAFAASLAFAGMGLTLLSAAPAQGQEDRAIRPIEVTVYRDIAYNGPAVAVDEAEEDLGLAWPVNSIRVRGGRWELCERTRFRGNCITVDRDTPRLGTILRGITIQSMRPIYDGAGTGSGGSNWTPEPPANDQTARGNFAQFHTQPQRNGRRIQACASGTPTDSCVRRTAEEFCRMNGWNGSPYHRTEVVARGVYLADVLCARGNY